MLISLLYRLNAKRSAMAREDTGSWSAAVHRSSSLASEVDLVMRVVCAICGSPPNAVLCDVIGDVTVQRCVRSLVDELRRRHVNDVRAMTSRL